LICVGRGSGDKLSAFTAEARDQQQVTSVGNFSAQLSLELVSYIGVRLIFLVIIIPHCSIKGAI
jgi:hypothetical protein